MKRSSSITLTKPRSLTQESVDKMRLESPGSPTDIPVLRSKRGRQPLMMGPDTKIFVVWLENFEDHENFPAGKHVLNFLNYLKILQSPKFIKGFILSLMMNDHLFLILKISFEIRMHLWFYFTSKIWEIIK